VHTKLFGVVLFLVRRGGLDWFWVCLGVVVNVGYH
jgi:hypothetical protein